MHDIFNIFEENKYVEKMGSIIILDCCFGLGGGCLLPDWKIYY
tara:strand:+ start:126 stop:254 length:129 start_codon:yes stop_codon:yes gene_type:complete